MMQALFSRVSFFRERALALFHRPDRLTADAAERHERWNQAIAGHQKPLDQPKSSSTSSTGGA
ncbi:MAG TPA: hypothetical protein VFB99_07145 [Vicinamibacterales bacterium]|nr:hypothetical protein [Vicinamibacterales bacterium]